MRGLRGWRLRCCSCACMAARGRAAATRLPPCLPLSTLDTAHDAAAAAAAAPLLLPQVLSTAAKVGVPMSGENALQRYDEYAFDKICDSAFGQSVMAGRLEVCACRRAGGVSVVAGNCLSPCRALCLVCWAWRARGTCAARTVVLKYVGCAPLSLLFPPRCRS